MTDDWTPAVLAAALRQLADSGLGRHDGYSVSEVHAEGAEVLLRLRLRDGSYRVAIPVVAPHVGINTGLPCEDPGHWAAEVGFTLSEEVATGGIRLVPRVLDPDGVTRLLF